MITKVEFEKAMEMDRQQTIKELMENCDLLLKSNRMLTENRLSESEYIVLEEGLWEKVKYGLAKLGRYKAGGKIFGKGKIDQEAGAKIQAILDKKGNEVIKALDAKIKETNPEFPNNEKGEQFLKTVMEIAAVYDSIVASTKKKPNEKGFLPADAANSIIADLAEYVQKFLDVDLAAAYTVMDSEEEKVDDDNDEELLTDEVEDIKEDEHSDVRDKLQAKAGKHTYDTKRMGSEGLASNKLPLVLAGVGGALGVLGWLAQTDFIKEIIIKIFGGDITITDTEKITNIIDGGHHGDPEGFVHWASKIMGKDLKTGADISEFVNKFGAEDVSHMFDGNGAGDSMTQVKQLQQLVGGENAGKSVGELFKSDTFGDMKQGRNLFGVSNSASFVSKTIITVVKKTVIKGAGTVIATKLAAIGSVLAPIGIGLIATGALVKLMRMKGLRQSRAKTLNDLLQSLQPVEDATTASILPDPKPNPLGPNKPDEPGQGGGGKGPGKGSTPNVPDEPGNGGGSIPDEFLKGNRNMQLAYLSELFLKPNASLWNRLGIKRGTVIPSGFLDAALGQGKVDQQKYLKAFYKHLKKEGSLVKDPGNSGAWISMVTSKETLALIKWVRNTRKNIGSFISYLKKKFPEFEIGERSKATTKKPGKRGESMGTSGINDSVNPIDNDLLFEAISFGGSAEKAGFDESILMKNLPQFMEMISSMYYSINGKKLPYNKDNVLKTCKSFGCKSGGKKGYRKTKSDDYVLHGPKNESIDKTDSLLVEEISRIKQLMK